jgi:hypothetical protein
MTATPEMTTVLTPKEKTRTNGQSRYAFRARSPKMEPKMKRLFIPKK